MNKKDREETTECIIEEQEIKTNMLAGEVMTERSKKLVHVLSSAKGHEFESQSPKRKLGNKITVHI